MPTVRQLWPLALALACNFDGTGFGAPPPAGSGAGAGGESTTAASTGPASSTTDPTTGGSTTSTTDLSTSSATTSPLTSTDPSTSSSSTSLETTGDDTTTTGDDTTTTSTTGPVPCVDVPYKQIVNVAASTTVAPMIKTMSNQGEGMIAFSEIAEQGTVTFPIDVPCDGQFYVWGRVRDAEPGTNNDDPDSFYTRADQGPESTWFYGCQTGGENATYRWKRVRSGMLGEPCDDNVVWPVSLTAGAHTITLRNREPKAQSGAIAVIARIMITSDPDVIPDPGD